MIPMVEERREEVAALCRRFGVRRLEIFGSGATGAFREGDSDLDFLVEFKDPLGGTTPSASLGSWMLCRCCTASRSTW